MEQYKCIVRCYREILAQGRKELSEIPMRQTGRRGPVANSDSQLERLDSQIRNVLRFALRTDTNRAEHDFRMAKVKQKISGCLRNLFFAETCRRMSSDLQTMTTLGYNPLAAITITLQGKAVDCLDQDA